MKTFATNGVIGSDPPRIDGVAKITGQAQYGADYHFEGLAYAFLATSAIARGMITSIDETIARAQPGVLTILTYENAGPNVIRAGKPMDKFGYSATSVAALDREIHYAGQLVAVVIADSFETARAAAGLLTVTYKEMKAAATFGSDGTAEVKPKVQNKTELSLGNFDSAYENAAIKIDARYSIPTQHHNPLELFQTTCAWQGDKLTIWESTQNSVGAQRGVAKQLELDHADVQVFSKFVGGAFGSRGQLATTTPIIAYAARLLKRPVKLVISRQQGFTLRTCRAATQHHVKLAASPDGKLQALSHESWELTSRTENFALAGSDTSCRLYACDNIKTKVHNIAADRQTPGHMRARPETPYMFAHESAMDELAYALKMDPVELRRVNDTQIEPIKKLPYTSRALMPCMDAAAEAFGWSKRTPEPKSMREGEWLIGYGCAAASYPAMIGPAHCRVTLFPQQKAKVEVGTHDIGTGAYTIIAQTAADQLKLPVEHIEVVIGDSSLPATPLTAGSSGSSNVCNVVAKHASRSWSASPR